MRGEFYTEHDIDDLIRQGVTTLRLGEDDRITDVGRERARSGGLKIIWNLPADEVAPHRFPPIASPSNQAASSSNPGDSHSQLRRHVRSSVLANIGSNVDKALVDDIIGRVFRKLGMD